MQHVIAHPDGILAIDSGFGRPGLAAVHIVIHQGRAAIIDAGTNASVPGILTALAAAGIEPARVDWLMLTHIHLDHAGGAGSLMCALPNAKVLLHPRALRHMVDPAYLLHATEDIYGADKVFEWYGRLMPIAEERLVVAEDGMIVDLAGRSFTVLDAPGHARHHICIYDEAARAFFSGDAFGISYRELDINGRAFVIPTTTPSQFDPDAMHATISRLMAYEPEAMYLTHYSRVVDVNRLASDLHRLVDAYVAVARAAGDEGVARHVQILSGLEQLIKDERERQGWVMSESDVLQFLRFDLELNAQGLGMWLDTAKEKKTISAQPA